MQTGMKFSLFIGIALIISRSVHGDFNILDTITSPAMRGSGANIHDANDAILKRTLESNKATAIKGDSECVEQVLVMIRTWIDKKKSIDLMDQVWKRSPTLLVFPASA